MFLLAGLDKVNYGLTTASGIVKRVLKGLNVPILTVESCKLY